eukprot:TRINITY_DN5718_c0_g2_i3.p1 TRINITY_DN5718_c0_g2~~TRINITY_DN5718_c0_g2_i3.p1  ORF type:complete len:157 (+),score=24.28 TRINITY_DN5718_c0_g2_i3:94-564(+)
MISIFLRVFFFLMIRRPPRSTLSSSSAASDVYKRQECTVAIMAIQFPLLPRSRIKHLLDDILTKYDAAALLKKKKGKKRWSKIIDALIKATKSSTKSEKNDYDASPRSTRAPSARATRRGGWKNFQAGSQNSAASARGGMAGGRSFGRGGRGRGRW